MVTFTLQHNDGITSVYNYYPEDNKNAEPGVITVYLPDNIITLDKAAEEDFLRTVSASDLNEMRESINMMRLESGKPPLTEEELPTASDGGQWYYYARHVMRRLRDDLEQGKISQGGTAAWY